VPLTGFISGVGDGEASISGNAGGYNKGYGVAVEFEGVSSRVGDEEVAVSGMKGEIRRAE